MANIKKNFNFRNGVQVDDDNLLVTDTGLVGIGTTIPNEALDVRGNIVVTGFTSTNTAQIGVLTVTTFVPNQITCLLYTSPSPRDKRQSRMPSSA